MPPKEPKFEKQPAPKKAKEAKNLVGESRELGLGIIRLDRERFPEFYQRIDRIDYGTLENIFASILRRSGIEAKNLNFLGKDLIAATTKDKKHGGDYSPDMNIAEINWEYIQRVAQEKQLEEGDIHSYILSILIHEETHAASKNVITLSARQTGFWRKAYNRSKKESIFLPKSDEKSVKYDAFFNLNEGVVERLAREVAAEYLKIAHDPQLKNIREIPSTAYHSEVRMVEFFTRLTAEIAGVPEDVVWHGIVRSLMEGEQFEDPDLIEMFEKETGLHLMQELSQVRSGEDADLMSLIMLRAQIRLQERNQTVPQEKNLAATLSPTFKERLLRLFFRN